MTFTPRSRTWCVVRVFFIVWWKPPGRDDLKLVFISCPISTASCTLTSISETTYSFTVLYSESDWCVNVCEWFHSSVKMLSLSSSSLLLLSSSLCFTVVAADAGPTLESSVHSIHCHCKVEQTPIDSIQTATCSGLVDMLSIPGGHVGLRVFKCTHTRWNYCCRKYGDGHLNQVSILNNWKVMSILQITSSYIWRPCWFSICGGW